MQIIRTAAMIFLAAAAGMAADDAQCLDMLRQALQAKNPETRKQGVVALAWPLSTVPLCRCWKACCATKTWK